MYPPVKHISLHGRKAYTGRPYRRSYNNGVRDRENPQRQRDTVLSEMCKRLCVIKDCEERRDQVGMRRRRAREQKKRKERKVFVCL